MDHYKCYYDDQAVHFEMEHRSPPLFRWTGSHLTMRIRQDAYKSMLRQDQMWFDRNENSVSSLTTYLSRDSELVHGAMGGRLGTLLQTITTLAVIWI